MASVKQLPTRMLQIIPSIYCDIPSPNVILENLELIVSENQDVLELTYPSPENLFQITNSSGHIENRVNVGDVIYLYNDIIAATVIEVISPTSIRINMMVPYGGGYILDFGIIFDNTTNPNSGCGLVVTQSGGLTIETAGNDLNGGFSGAWQSGIYFNISVLNEPYTLPVQVKKVISADVPNSIYAIW